MRAILVRVKEAAVYVDGKIFSKIEKGIVVFVSFKKTDKDLVLVNMAKKILNLRIFENEAGKLDYSIKDKNYSILCIPNFTLYANTSGGRRPSFEDVMEKQKAASLFNDFIMLLKSENLYVGSGLFGEYMNIEMVADGPVNIILEEN